MKHPRYGVVVPVERVMGRQEFYTRARYQRLIAVECWGWLVDTYDGLFPSRLANYESLVIAYQLLLLLPF